MARALPSGVWAVASGLTPDGLGAWMRSAAAADAWTVRRPRATGAALPRLLAALRAEAAWLAVHGRSDWAALAGADALIAGARGLPWSELAARVAAWRSQLAPGFALGASVHDPSEQARAVAAGARFLVYGPIWETPSKRGVLAPRGLDALAERAAAGLPVVAIGGVDSPERVAAARAAGAHAVAVLRAAQDPVLLAELVSAAQA